MEDENRVIVRRICDKSMAEKKGLLRNCTRRCRGCVAAIEVDEYGHFSHTPFAQGDGVTQIRIRNEIHAMNRGKRR